MFKGIGAKYGKMLENINIRCVDDLTKWEPKDLYEKLKNESANYLFFGYPRLGMVTVWVLSAKGIR